MSYSMKSRNLCFTPLPLLVLSLAGCFTNPVTGRKELIATSPEQELSLGAQSFADVQKSEKVSSDAAANERVNRVGRRIAKAVGNDVPNANWEFVVFDSNQVNAFALPGGHVGVYTGLLKLATSDDELAIVLGHEIGHVTARHGAERITQAQALALAGQLGAAALGSNAATAQYQSMFNLAYGVGTNVGVTLPHSRQQESEADRMGLVYAARAGYDPRAAITFWRKMMARQQQSATGTFGKFLSDHPADEERIRDIEAQVPSVLGIYEQNRTQR